MSAPAAPSPTTVHFEVTDDGQGSATLTIAGDAYGDPANPPVLMIHGGGQTRHSWGTTAMHIAEQGWYAIAYDQRGHGDSSYSPAGFYTSARYAWDLIEISHQLSQPPIVVGASLGGLAAMLAAGSFEPSAIAAVVLVDITPRQEHVGVDRVVNFMLDRAETGFADLDEAADAVARYNPKRPRPKDLSGLQKNLRLGDDGRWRWHWDPNIFGSERGIKGRQEPDQFVKAAAKIAQPILLVRGRDSDLVSPETAQEFLELVPHAEFVDVSGAGHMVAGDRNDRFSEAVVGFLTGRRTG